MLAAELRRLTEIFIRSALPLGQNRAALRKVHHKQADDVRYAKLYLLRYVLCLLCVMRFLARLLRGCFVG